MAKASGAQMPPCGRYQLLRLGGLGLRGVDEGCGCAQFLPWSRYSGNLTLLCRSLKKGNTTRHKLAPCAQGVGYCCRCCGIPLREPGTCLGSTAAVKVGSLNGSLNGP